MKTITTREFYHSPSLVKGLRAGQSLVVTDNGKISFTVTKAGQRPKKTAADLRREARDIAPEKQTEIELHCLAEKTPLMIYADTSFIVASRFRFDTWHNEATAFYAPYEETPWLWSPWHHVEVFHALRQYGREDNRRRGLTATEAKQLIRRLETDVRLGYFENLESDWRDVLRTAREISVEHGFSVAFSSADLLHVAYAIEMAAELFVSFDDDQLALASAAGLSTADPRG